MRTLTEQHKSASVGAAAGVVVVWFDDLDALLGLGAGALQEEIGENEVVLERRQQIVKWLRWIPMDAPLVMVGTGACVTELRRVMPELVGSGAFEQTIRLRPPALPARVNILRYLLAARLNAMAEDDPHSTHSTATPHVGQGTDPEGRDGMAR